MKTSLRRIAIAAGAGGMLDGSVAKPINPVELFAVVDTVMAATGMA